MRINPGATGQSVYFKLTDTVGQPAQGLTITNLALTYTRDKTAPVSNTATALASAVAVWSVNGVFELSSGIVPGLYRADFPDAAFASGVLKVQLGVKGAAIDPAYIEVELDYDPVTAIINNVAPVTVTNGVIDANLKGVLGTILTESISGYISAGLKKFFDVATPTLTVASVNQTGDAFASCATLLSRVVGTILAGNHNPQSGDVYPKVDTEIGTILTNLTTVITHLTDIKGTGWTTQTLKLINDTLVALNNISTTQVRAQVDAGITAAGLATAANLVTANSNISSILEIAQKLDGMLELNGALYEFTLQALINSPIATGGFGDADRTMITAIKAKTDALPSGIKKGVALSNFPIVMTSDGITPLAGLTVSGFVRQDAGSFAALTNAVVEVAYGAYRINLTALEMTADMITLRFTASGAKERQISFLTV
jgi:hypothetical protein